MSLSIKIIKADIKTARNNLSPIINLTNDEMLYNIAAYHAQQAVEKCLKIVLIQRYGVDESSRKIRTHDIAGLIGMMEDHATDDSPIPTTIPDEIRLMAAEITEWEAAVRYHDDKVILRKNIRNVIKLCQGMVKELEEKGFK